MGGGLSPGPNLRQRTTGNRGMLGGRELVFPMEKPLNQVMQCQAVSYETIYTQLMDSTDCIFLFVHLSA